MPAILQVLAALLRSHGADVGRHVKGLILWGALIVAFAVLAGIYFIILLTHLLTLLLGTALALAVMTALALFAVVVAALKLRSEKRRLVATHREHVEQERLAMRAAIAELVATGKLSGSLAAVSATVAAVLVVILRRLRSEDGAGAAGNGGDEPPAAGGAGA